MNRDAPAAARPRRRWLQFRLRTLLALTLIASLPLWAFNARLQKVRRQRRAATAVNAAGGDVWFAAAQNSAKPASPPAAVVFYSGLQILHLGKTGVTFEGANAFEHDLPRSPIIR